MGGVDPLHPPPPRFGGHPAAPRHLAYLTDPNPGFFFLRILGLMPNIFLLLSFSRESPPVRRYGPREKVSEKNQPCVAVKIQKRPFFGPFSASTAFLRTGKCRRPNFFTWKILGRTFFVFTSGENSTTYESYSKISSEFLRFVC